MASLVCTDIASEHVKIERSSMSHMNVVIDISMSTLAAMPPAVTIGGGRVNWGRVIAEIILGITFLAECILII